MPFTDFQIFWIRKVNNYFLKNIVILIFYNNYIIKIKFLLENYKLQIEKVFTMANDQLGK